MPARTGLVADLPTGLVAGLVAGLDPLPPPAAATQHTAALRPRRVAPTAVRWSQPSPPRSPVGEWAGGRLHRPARAGARTALPRPAGRLRAGLDKPCEARRPGPQPRSDGPARRGPAPRGPGADARPSMGGMRPEMALDARNPYRGIWLSTADVETGNSGLTIGGIRAITSTGNSNGTRKARVSGLCGGVELGEQGVWE